MNKFIHLIFLILLLSSCSKNFFQISSIESNSVNEDFIFENKDIKLEYGFWGERGILSFKIINKLDQPLFFDWEHSNFIFNGYSYNYFTNKEEFLSSTIGIYSNESYISNNGYLSIRQNAMLKESISGTIKKETKNVQIPPKSYIEAKIVNLNFPTFRFNKNDSYSFSIENTPLRIRTYLGYSLNKNFSSLEYIDNEFWIDEIYMRKANESVKKSKHKNFYNSIKKIDFIKTVVVVGGLTGLAYVFSLLL